MADSNNNHISSNTDEAPNVHNQQKPRVDDEMQRVLALIAARSRGEVSNDAVEAAVNQLLQATGCANTTAAPAAAASQPVQNHPVAIQQPQQEHPIDSTKIEADEDDYDDDDNDNGDKKVKATSRKRPRRKDTKSSSKEATPSRRRKSSILSKNENVKDDAKNEEMLDQIPLGRQGAKMMTTFGDGSRPRAPAVAAALLGARHMLQVAIRDARAVRRRDKEQFDLAKVMTMAKKKTSLATHAATAAIDSTMLYRAMEGYDKLAFEVKCGFDMEQLRVLFPEEMNAYAKWNEVSFFYFNRVVFAW
jgi:hypothetical protein